MTSELTAASGATQTTPATPTSPASPDPSLLVGRGYWPRAAAYVIDVLTVVFSTYSGALFGGVILGLLRGAISQPPNLDAEVIDSAATLFGGGAFLAYFVLGEWLAGATLGKLLLGLRVVRRDGRPCGPGGALLRTIVRFFDGLFFGLPALLSMREPLNQRFGDRAAGTMVVDAGSLHLVDPRPRWAVPLALLAWAAGQFLALMALLLLAAFA